MLKVELTKNYAGVKISGDFNDLDYLYDSIHYLIKNDPKSIGEYLMQNHIYGFLYDVRHAYQGDREALLVDNLIQDMKREWLGIKKKDATNKNIYFSFNYLLPDIFLDIILIKYFTLNLDKKENNVYNSYLNMVNYFYSLVLNSLKNFLTEIKFNKVKRGIIKAFTHENLFIPQWFEIISVDYAKMTKKEREKEFMHVMDAIYNYMDYQDYYTMKKDLEKLCEEQNCNLDSFHYDNYPNEIEW